MRIALAATFTAEPLARSLGFWRDRLGWKDEVALAPYGRLWRELADPAGLFLSGGSVANVVLLRHEDWLRFAAGDGVAPDPEARRAILRERNRELVDAVARAAGLAGAPFLVVLCPPSEEWSAEPERAAMLLALEGELEADLGRRAGVHVLSWRTSLALYGCDDPRLALDAHADALGHVPYSALGFAVLGAAIARTLHALRAPPKKAIVLDCDQTLWRGVLGEDGPEGVVVDDARRRLQELVRERRRQGLLLCLCSKNDEAEVLSFIDSGRGMVLGRDDLAAWRIGWRPKSESLRELARELGLGLESFVFVDDDARECAEVEAGCPEVTTVRLPEDEREIPGFLEHVWVLDRPIATTDEDRDRTRQYRLARDRERLRKGSGTLGDFLAGLELRVGMALAEEDDLARVSQLTRRTNQLNLTTIRRSEPELRSLLAGGAWRCLCVRVSDRFGAYGLVGAAVYRVAEGRLDVDTFLLSCRVLGRGVEHRVLSRLGEIAAASGAVEVRLAYIPSARNGPARELLESALGRYGRPSKDGVEYTVPSAEAAAVRLRTDVLAEPAAAPEAAELAQAPPVEAGDSALYRSIAALRTGRLLLEAMSGAGATVASGAGVTVARGAGAPVASGAAYQDDIEAAIGDIVGRLLGTGDAPREANFYELGGDSLMGIQALAEIRRRFDVELPIDVLFADACSVARLALEVHAMRAAAGAGHAKTVAT